MKQDRTATKSKTEGYRKNLIEKLDIAGYLYGSQSTLANLLGIPKSSFNKILTSLGRYGIKVEKMKKRSDETTLILISKDKKKAK